MHYWDYLVEKWKNNLDIGYHFPKTTIIIFSFSLVKTEQFLDERKNYSPKRQTKCESSKESQHHSKSSAHKIGETSSPKASSTVARLKKKQESFSKETEPVASKRKENAIELKETRTPKKTKSSPAKKEVEISQNCIMLGLCVDLGLIVFKFISNFVSHYSTFKMQSYIDVVEEHRLLI